LALSVPLSRFAPRVGGVSAFYVRLKMPVHSTHPVVWCDFNACGWSGRPHDNCFYLLDQKRLAELGAKVGDKVFLYMEDSDDGREVTGIEGELVDSGGKLIARPFGQEFYNGPRFW
jgi:hypothetical protein